MKCAYVFGVSGDVGTGKGAFPSGFDVFLKWIDWLELLNKYNNNKIKNLFKNDIEKCL